MNDTERKSTAFKNSELGRDLGESVCEELFQIGELRHFKNGEMIFNENDEAEGIYLVLNGVVKLVRYTFEGREVILHHTHEKHFFAEAAIFLGKYPAAAISYKKSELLFLRKANVLKLMQNHTEFMMHIFTALSRWLKFMVDKIDQLTLNDATARIARHLLDLLRDNKKASRKTISVTLNTKKGELATMLNMNQATLSRSLRKLQDDDVLKVDGRTFKIMDYAKLQDFSLPSLD